MKSIFLIISFVLLCGSAPVPHPLHVSVTNISIENGELKGTMNTFSDDWETAYFHFYGKRLAIQEKENYLCPWMKEYFASHLSIATSMESPPYSFVIDTVYYEDLSMHIEFHSESKIETNSLYIYNALLCDVFADQSNLLILSKGDREKGIKFDYKKRSESIELN